MVFGVNPVRLLAKLPVPLPSVVLEPVIVGLVAVPQQTPLAVTSAPPSPVIFPPDVATVVVIPFTEIVVKTGGEGFFLQEVWNTIEHIKKIALIGILIDFFKVQFFP